MGFYFFLLKSISIRIYYKIDRVFFKPDTAKKSQFLKKIYHKGVFPEILSIEQTIDYVINNNCSIARYGDGEIALMTNKSIRFQRSDFKLAKKLYNIIKANQTKCLIAIVPLQYIDSDFSIEFRYTNLLIELSVLNKNRLYGNTGLSRGITPELFAKLKLLWLNRCVIFVYGENSRFNENHMIFNDIEKKIIVLGTSVNSWEVYDTVFFNVKEEYKKNIDLNPIVLISLGPTATVLAYDLSLEKIQALDLGHITNCYDLNTGVGELPEKMDLIIK